MDGCGKDEISSANCVELVIDDASPSSYSFTITGPTTNTTTASISKLQTFTNICKNHEIAPC
ncbi:5082_t:CDS:2, partial [Entrophospora sp. SA101]